MTAQTTDQRSGGLADAAVQAGLSLRDLPPFQIPGWRVVVSIMQKGGVGKTATAAGLISHLASMGIPVVGIDLCHTGALTQSFGLTRVEGDENLAKLMSGDYDGSIYDLAVPVMPNAWLVPISVDAITIAEDLAGAKFREELLRGALMDDEYGDLPAKAVVVIDCPPTLDLRTDNALIAGSDDGVTKQWGGTLLCPELVEASLETLDLLLDQIDAINRTRYKVRHLGWFASETDNTNSTKRARAIMEKLPLDALGEMPRRTRIRDARNAGQPLLTFDPKSDANHIHRQLTEKVKEKLSV